MITVGMKVEVLSSSPWHRACAGQEYDPSKVPEIISGTVVKSDDDSYLVAHDQCHPRMHNGHCNEIFLPKNNGWWYAEECLRPLHLLSMNTDVDLDEIL